MWVRAVWMEGKREEEGVIPEVWIENKTVRWPDGINVLRARTEQRQPTEKWHKFPLVKVKFRSGQFSSMISKSRMTSHFISLFISLFRGH